MTLYFLFSFFSSQSQVMFVDCSFQNPLLAWLKSLSCPNMHQLSDHLSSRGFAGIATVTSLQKQNCLYWTHWKKDIKGASGSQSLINYLGFWYGSILKALPVKSVIENQKLESARIHSWLWDRDTAQVDAESPPLSNEILIHNCIMSAFLNALYAYFAFVIHSGQQ